MPFRILVVDDETAIREAIRMTLEYEGYRIDEARSGQDGGVSRDEAFAVFEALAATPWLDRARRLETAVAA